MTNNSTSDTVTRRPNVFIGYHASHEQLPPSDLLISVIRAEAAGFDGAMCSDHLAPWGLKQGQSGYAWSWLGAALASTSFSVGVVTAPGQRYHPVITAQAIATLEQMFPGRFWAALGSGEAVNEHVTGDPWPPKPQRNARLEASVDVIRQLLAGHEVSRDDDLIRVHAARVWSLPESPPPLLGAAVTAETAAWLARWADGLATVAQPPDVLGGVLSAYQDAGGTGPRVLQVHVSLEDTEAQALQVAREQWAQSAIRQSLWDIEQPAQFDELAGDPSDDELRRGAMIADDAVALADRIAALAAGFDRVYIHGLSTDQPAFLDRAERDLLPALRDALGGSR